MTEHFSSTPEQSNESELLDLEAHVEQMVSEGRGRTPGEQLADVQQYLGEVSRAAAMGALHSGDGKVLSENDVYEQLASMYEIINLPLNSAEAGTEFEQLRNNPAVIVSRSNGLRRSIDTLLSTPGYASALLEAIKRREDDKMYEQSSEGQRQSRMVGSQAIKAAGEFAMMFGDLSPEEEREMIKKAAVAVPESAAEKLTRERRAADHAYNLARQSGASHEDAQESADRAFGA